MFSIFNINAVVNKDKIYNKTIDHYNSMGLSLDPSGALSDVFFFFCARGDDVDDDEEFDIFFFFFFFFCDRGDDVDDDKEFDLFFFFFGDCTFVGRISPA